MHVVMFGDQHVASLGGAQVSMRLQREFLERAGHVVSIVAPALHGRRGAAVAPDPALLDVPSLPITIDREYSLSWPGARADRWIDGVLVARPPVDIVHVQADFWGAFLGHRFAARHDLPVVHTMHNRVDVGIAATTPAPRATLRALTVWQRHAIASKTRGVDGWTYLRRFAERASAVTAPSSHFARRLEAHGVVPAGGNGEVDVIWNGIHDDLLDEVRRSAPARGSMRPRLVWLGRMSPEKRLLPFLQALAFTRPDADVEIIGGGGQLRAAQRFVTAHGMDAATGTSVGFAGRLPYAETLRRIHRADAVVQTSIGFETQGMTVFEAASLGTPALVSDPDIAGELGAGRWDVADGSVEALGEAIRVAVADIAAGTAAVPDAGVAEAFRQSSRTAAMIEVYDRVR
ncbi:glycosyltransferase family 4 protein [Microbacterium sp. SSW1-59]|uniref:glycosyltransferase family 4 protein n=1 Tax=Microbacterium xanthum TaxID=3079794 RepID=UPI002AD35BD8|nr:glycosyltransferase family 4 protein [Microbacterium sp. SSW1-59]MDZ8200859.1 glycosyltransferase family 4 protein [Microbacterium sp. SSW1-59]